MPNTTSPSPFVSAIYRTETSRLCAGNPYIEALPPLPSDAQLAQALTVTPPFDTRERDLPATQRIELVSRLSLVHVAFPRVIALARAMLWLLYVGYRKRRPFTIADNEAMQALYASQMSGNFTSVGDAHLAPQYSMSIIGTSGSGKTFSLRHIADLLPSVIYHEKIGKWQLPYLFVEMPYDGISAHMLASAIFEELDRLMVDAKYGETFSQGRGMNAQRRLTMALAIAREHAVGQIIVDESQSSSLKDKVTAQPKITGQHKKGEVVQRETVLIKQMIRASNSGHIPLVFSGTPELKARLGRFSMARRLAGRGSQTWGPLSYDEVEILLKALLRLQFIQKPIELTGGWVNFIADMTQGLPDIIVKLIEQSQIHAITSKVETLTQELVTEVFYKNFETTEFGIEAIRSMDETMLSIASDIDVDWALPGQRRRTRMTKVSTRANSATANAPSPVTAPRPRRGRAAIHQSAIPVDPTLVDRFRNHPQSGGTVDGGKQFPQAAASQTGGRR